MSSKNHNLKHKAPNRARVKPNRDEPTLDFDDLGDTKSEAIRTLTDLFRDHMWQEGGTGASLRITDVLWRALAPVPVSVLANKVPGAFLVRNRITRRAVADALSTLAWDVDD